MLISLHSLHQALVVKKKKKKPVSFKNVLDGGTWVVQLVKHLTLDFGSDHDLSVLGSSPAWGSMLSMEPA